MTVNSSLSQVEVMSRGSQLDKLAQSFQGSLDGIESAYQDLCYLLAYPAQFYLPGSILISKPLRLVRQLSLIRPRLIN